MHQRLRELRENAGLSQTDVAKYLKITRQAYNHYETGKRTPDPKAISELAKLFGVTTDYLLGRENIGTAEKKEPGTQTDAELSELNSIISRLSDGNRAKLRELAQLYLDSEQRKEENG